ncbi:GatB/YqeY domain-containing protein [Algoriphagus aquimarinus]|uniref:GatB/YqeY domain-containing protein n=1 Tax=Algoriphagus aquimarinus TaxID=237018 RepID=A0A5C7B1N5_9BACT|nr:GatB/YqeY domain-containing protein [Algoriphagus aquimarinus]TXE14337.1 GatB/YqeY domain-containing protein [Algoriphagus aquimarinus]
MSLKQKIESEIKSAMIARDKIRLGALRSIKSLILLEETKSGAKADITEEDELKLLTKAAKQRKDSADIYEQQARFDLYEVEMAELKVLQEFLPVALTDEEISAAIKEIIAQTGASSPKDMGKVMGVASKQLAGKADGKVISEKVKAILNS